MPLFSCMVDCTWHMVRIGTDTVCSACHSSRFVCHLLCGEVERIWVRGPTSCVQVDDRTAQPYLLLQTG